MPIFKTGSAALTCCSAWMSGNVSFRSPGAGSVVEALIDLDVVSSFRKPDSIRFGVSPLVISHVDIHEAVMRLKRILAEEIWKQPKYRKVSV